MDSTLHQIVEQIHASGRRVALVITGGGSEVIAELLRVPGASRTVLEAIVPYDYAALSDVLGREPEHACSPETAIALARRALERAADLAGEPGPLVGLGVTASLASDRPKRGEHRCHIAAATDVRVVVVSIVLAKGARDRIDEEEVVARAALLVLAGACGVPAPDVATVLEPGDRLTRNSFAPQDPIGQLLTGEVARVTVLPDGQCATAAPIARGTVAGSFNPLHVGHRGLARVAAEMLDGPVAFEISVVNVDKPPLAATEVRRRLRQFAWWATVELTRAPTFLEKARVLPGVTFVVGVDTATRIVDPVYYGGSPSAMLAALDEISQCGCRFLVAGRVNEAGHFRTLFDIAIPGPFAGAFIEIPESRFRMDISSTGLRAATERSLETRL